MGDEVSLRDSVAAAVESLEGGGDEAPEVEAAPEAAQGEQPEAEGAQDVTIVEKSAEERARDDAGRFAKAPKGAKKPNATPAPKPGEAPAGTPAPAKPNGVATPPPVQGAADGTKAVKPPASWSVATREKWGQLPADVQAEVHRRERETAVALQEAAEARRHHEAFRQTVAPYEGMIRAEGGEPLRAVQSLLQTAAALRTSPPVHKAQLVANLIRTFGVPIEALDAALAGQPPPQGAQGAQYAPNGMAPGPYQDPRVDQLLARMQQAEAQRASALQQEAHSVVSAFQGEFLDDVREEMADLMEAAGKRGLKLSIEDAYNRAVLLHPEISAVLEQRKAAANAANASASMQRAKAAGSSVRTRPAGGGAPPQLNSIREYVAHAVDEVEGR